MFDIATVVYCTIQSETAYKKESFSEQAVLFVGSKGKGRDKDKTGAKNQGRNASTHEHHTRCVCTYYSVMFNVLLQQYEIFANGFSEAKLFLCRSRGPVVEVNTTGIHADQDKSINVTFHVLVPLEMWNWNANSRIRIQFGHQRLGNWKFGIGEFCSPRYN